MIMLSNENLNSFEFYKEEENNKMWSVHEKNCIGPVLVSFDKKKIYNLWTDYPKDFTKEEIKISKKEMPFWYNSLTKTN